MEKLIIKNYELKDGCYMKNDVKMTTFTLAVKKIVKKDGGADYQFEVELGGQKVSDIFTTAQINRNRFLKDMSLFIEDETEFYRLLRRAVFEKTFAEDEVLYQTNCNGLQEVNGKWMYVYTNGSIGKDGFHSEVYSGIEGMYIPKNAVLDLEHNKETIERLFKEYNSNPEVFYPLFLTNIMAITNGYFRKIGEENFMKLTLWLDGKSGSGKTELAKAVGTYTFNDKDLNKRLVSVTGKRRYALRCLAESSGNVCILDDVKHEAIRERRNSVKNTVDDYIRSVFQGILTDSDSVNSKPQSIDTCAIITGEYFETEESQNARMLYLKVDGFLKDNRNSKALRVLQKNPMWVTTVCTGYIQWLLAMMEEISFSQLLINKLEEMRDRPKLYGGINNAERLIESRYMIEMSAILAKMYFEYICMPEDFINSFASNATKSIQNICDNTYYLLGAEEMVILKVMKKIFSDCHIRKAKYEECCWGNFQYYQQYFWIDDNDDFVWIDDYGKSLLKRDRQENGQYDYQPCLIIREERLRELFKTQIEVLINDNQISSPIADKIWINLLKKLREMQIIYKQYRADCKWGRPAVNYPVNRIYYTCKPKDDNQDYYSPIVEYVKVENAIECKVHYEPVIQINIEHECVSIVMERMNSNDYSEDLKGINYNSDIKEKEEVYKVRKSFISNKSLYRE